MNKKIWNLLVYCACFVFCLVVSWLAGHEVHWDLLNYHLYAPHAYLNCLIGKDFMGANLSGYMNPIPYIPFYLMMRAGWHSLTIGMALAAIHSIALLLLWPICRLLLNDTSNITEKERWHLALAALLLGGASPFFLMQLGSTFADVTTTVVVMAGVLLLLKGMQQQEKFKRYTFLGGMFLGAAVWLKYSNAPFALAAGVFVLLPGLSLMRRVGYLLRLAAGGITGSLIVAGHWWLTLYREFGNPLFPMFTNFFNVQKAGASTLRHMRFIPDSFLDTLLLPFKMVDPVPWVYAEVTAPDSRFAIFFILLLLVVALKLGERIRKPPLLPIMPATQSLFLLYVLVCWVLWAVLFVNGRYFIPLTLLIGPAVIILLTQILRFRRAMLVVLLIAVVQIVQVYCGSLPRYGDSSSDWPKDWLELDIPKKLMKKPHLSLGMEMQSNSFLALYYHPDSRFVNVNGMLHLDLDRPGGERIERLLDAYRGRTRIVVHKKKPENTTIHPDAEWVVTINRDLNRFGLAVDQGDCLTIVNRSVPAILLEAGDALKSQGRHDRLLSCGVHYVPVDTVIAADRARAMTLFDQYERACPELFPLAVGGEASISKGWRRYYNATDLWLVADDKRVWVRHFRGYNEVLGRRDALEEGRQAIVCPVIPWRSK